jgi:hypothetical protein
MTTIVWESVREGVDGEKGGGSAAIQDGRLVLGWLMAKAIKRASGVVGEDMRESEAIDSKKSQIKKELMGVSW